MDGHWAAAAAGHVEAGESVLEAAAREAAEELGIGIEPADLLPLCAMHRTVAPHGPIDERVDFFFECRRWSGRAAAPSRRTSQSDLRWFDLDALPDPVVPHELQVMTALRDGTLQPIVTHGFLARVSTAEPMSPRRAFSAGRTCSRLQGPRSAASTRASAGERAPRARRRRGRCRRGRRRGG